MNEFIQNLAPQNAKVNNLTLEKAKAVLERDLDYSVIPDIFLVWKGSNKNDGTYLKAHAIKTGKTTIIPRYDGNVCSISNIARLAKELDINYDMQEGWYHYATPRGYDLTIVYVKYHEDVQYLELSRLSCDAKRGEDGVARPISKDYGTSILISKDFKDIWINTSRWSTYTQRVSGLRRVEETRRPEFKKEIKSAFDNYINLFTYRDKIMKEFEKLTGSTTVTSTGKYSYTRSVITPYSIQESIIQGTDPRAKKTDEVLEKINNICNNLPFEKYIIPDNEPEKNWYNSDTKLMITYDNIDGIDIFRYITKKAGHKYNEKYRLVIPEDGTLRIYERYLNDFVRSSTATPGIHAEASYHYNFKEIEKSQNLKYIKDIIVKDKNPIQMMIDIYRHPIVEKLIKSGFPAIANSITYNGTIQANLKHVFNCKEKKGDLFKVVGLNKHQMKTIENFLNSRNNDHNNNYYYRSLYTRVVKTMQYITGIENISTLDDKTSDAILFSILRLSAGNCSWLRYFNFTPEGKFNEEGGHYWRFDVDTATINEESRKFLLKLIKLNYEEHLNNICSTSDIIEVLCDSISMVQRIHSDEYKPDINFFSIKNIDQAVLIHNNIVELNNAYQNEQRRRWQLSSEEKNEENKIRMEKLNKERHLKFDYEDSDFKIMLPETPADLVNEGCNLHHCVGGYVDRVANGQTNIIFIRKKDDLKESYLTVEVNNYNQVIQAHAKFNAWMGTIPEVIPFFIDWISEKGIMCDKHIILSTATGYSSGGFKDLDGTPYGI